MGDDLTTLKDDMVAFIEGHGMKRFRGYVSDDVQSVTWSAEGDPDSWKDFVELAKAAGLVFLTMNDVVLEKSDLEYLTKRLEDCEFANDDDLDEARSLLLHLGKTGFVQLGFSYNGSLFIFEASAPWYDRYQRLMDLAEEVGGLTIGEPGSEDDH